MPYAKHGTLYCPCCAARIDIEITDSGLVYAAVHGILLNKFEEAGAEAEGGVRPGDLPEGVHEGIHAPKGGSGEKA